MMQFVSPAAFEEEMQQIVDTAADEWSETQLAMALMIKALHCQGYDNGLQILADGLQEGTVRRKQESR